MKTVLCIKIILIFIILRLLKSALTLITGITVWQGYCLCIIILHTTLNNLLKKKNNDLN